MANSDHLQILKRGVEVWNAWRDQHKDIRPDLSGADLTKADLAQAHFHQTNLTGATLTGAECIGAEFIEAALTEADLTSASLLETNFSGADLTRATLTEADFTTAVLAWATLTGADITKAVLYGTVFGDTDLTDVRGLETCDHLGPSILDHHTLARSGPLPLAFLRGCGLPDALIEYLPSILGEPFQFYSCFISHASKDRPFAERLYADLQNKGVRCTLLPNT